MAQAVNTAGRLQDQGDVNVSPAVGVDGYAFTYDHDTGKFVLATAGGAKVGGTGEANALVIGADQTRPVVLLQEDLGYGGSYGVFKPLAVSLNFTYATYVTFKNGVYYSGSITFSSDASYDANKKINFLAGNSAAGAWINNPHATLARLALAAGNAVRMTIDEAGLVGIGTTAPTTRLDIDAGALTMAEMTAPTGAANKAMLYTRDNGSGKTQLCCKLGDDVEIVLATQA